MHAWLFILDKISTLHSYYDLHYYLELNSTIIIVFLRELLNIMALSRVKCHADFDLKKLWPYSINTFRVEADNSSSITSGSHCGVRNGIRNCY